MTPPSCGNILVSCRVSLFNWKICTFWSSCCNEMLCLINWRRINATKGRRYDQQLRKQDSRPLKLQRNIDHAIPPPLPTSPFPGEGVGSDGSWSEPYPPDRTWNRVALPTFPSTRQDLTLLLHSPRTGPGPSDPYTLSPCV